jgi:hypothetical protein
VLPAGWLAIEGIRFRCVIGVNEHERLSRQEIIADLHVEVDFERLFDGQLVLCPARNPACLPAQHVTGFRLATWVHVTAVSVETAQLVSRVRSFRYRRAALIP